MQQKSNITSQGASASVNERSRKIRFGFQFWLESFFHGEQNVQFAQNLKNLKKLQGILIRINAFVAWAWCRCLLQVIVVHNTWLVQTSNTILIVVSWANRGSSKVGTMYAGTITFFVFFEDYSRSRRWI